VEIGDGMGWGGASGTWEHWVGLGLGTARVEGNVAYGVGVCFVVRGSTCGIMF